MCLRCGHAIGQRQQLVDLLFVFGEHQFGFAVAQEIRCFLVEHVAIEAKAHGADRVAGDFGRHPVRPIVADDADHVATAETEFDHAEREIVHPGLVIIPCEQPPQPEVFFAQRDLIAVFAGIETQQPRIGISLGDAAGIIHHAALSAGCATSSGSTSTSSSSPR